MFSKSLVKIAFSAVFLFSIALISCSNADDNADDRTTFGIFKVIDSNTVEANGEINSNSLSNFNRLLSENPDINRIEIKEISGSSDDDINLQVSLVVFQQNINTHLLENGSIASGGVDFFLAGVERTKGTNTEIGVHSWTDGTNEARDFPEGHANHTPYIDYYKSVGFSQEDAEAFYYFTINAAPAAGIHWMTEAEIAQYKVLTQ